MSRLKESRWKLVLPLASLVAVAAALVAATASASPSAQAPLKLAILSDCQGAFGAFYEADIGGAQAAFMKFGHGKPVDAKKPSAGMNRIILGGRQIKIVGYGCSNDTAAKAIAETKRLMEKLGADIMIGPLSGDEGSQSRTTRRRIPRRRSSTAPRARRTRRSRCGRRTSSASTVTARSGRPVSATSPSTGSAGRRRPRSPTTTRSRGPRRAARSPSSAPRRQDHEAGVPAAEHDRLLVVRAADAAADQVDGYFWAVGGAGLVPSLKAFEQRFGPLPKGKFIGNLFWSDPLQYKELSDRGLDRHLPRALRALFAGELAAAPDAPAGSERREWTRAQRDALLLVVAVLAAYPVFALFGFQVYVVALAGAASCAGARLAPRAGGAAGGCTGGRGVGGARLPGRGCSCLPRASRTSASSSA